MGRTTSSRRSAIFEPFKTVWVVDVEYCQHPTGLPDIVCLAAREILSGRGFSLWRDQLRPWPPYDIGEDSLFVCYSGMEAELACHLVFNWPLPANVVDLIVEYRMAVNGIELGGEKYGLLEAATRLGIPLHVSKEEKDRIRSRIIAGWPFSDTEQAEILAYCMADVDEEAVVLRELGPEAMSPWAVWRGRFVKSVSRMWYRGVPIDPKYVRLMNDPVVRSELRGEIIDDLQQAFPFFDGLVLKNALVTEWLENNSIPVPKTPTGRTEVSHEKLEKIARDHPILEPFIEGQRVLAQLQDSSMPIGSDNRLRAWFAPFWTKTSRAAPPTNGYIYNLPAWVRATMSTNDGLALAYLDWSAMEFGIAAALSSDRNMQAFYRTHDPYLAAAVAFGALPPGATKQSDPGMHEVFKRGLLACQYGCGAPTLAARIKRPTAFARRFLELHHETFSKYWPWSDGVVAEMIRSGLFVSRHGWRYVVRPTRRKSDGDRLRTTNFNLQSLRNIPIQLMGAEILRLACILADDLDIEMIATAHDAVLIQAPEECIDQAAAKMAWCMERASEVLTDGFTLFVKADIRRHGERFVEERGSRTLQIVDRFLTEERHVQIG